MATMTKSKKKRKSGSKKGPKTTRIPVQVESEWLNCGIDVAKKNRGLRLVKRLCSTEASPHFESPLGWLLTPDVDSATLRRINAWHRALLNKQKPKRVAEEIIYTIQSFPEKAETPGDALIVLAACYAIRSFVGKCELEDWQSLVAHLFEISQAAEANVQLAPEVYQQLAIEVPLTIAFQIPEIEDYQQLAARNCQKMAIAVSDMLDHDGWPNAQYLSSFGPLVASWVRCSVMTSELELEQGLEAASQLEWLVRQVLRMLRPDRTLVFSHPDSAPATDAFLKCLLILSSDPDDKKLLKLSKSNNRELKPAAAIKEIETSNISEWSESALLQSGWEHGSPKVAVDFSANRIRTEICREVNLVQGDAMPEISINGATLHSSEPFEVACIESNEDVAYLELQRDLGKGVTLTRQYLLSRTEEFLLIADVVVPETAARIDYRGNWPLARGIEGMHESETREVYLSDAKKIQALVLPIALPEWKVGRSDDKLDFQNRCMCLTQSINGHGLYAPLFFDLSPKRSKKKRTWRQLTVAEDLNKVYPDVACAFRVQLDKQQWFFYRVVSEFGIRTYMGKNTACEFVFSRFSKNGSVKDLIEVESPDALSS